MKVCVATILECLPDRVWAELQTSRLLLEVMRPLLRFVPPRPACFPVQWKQSATVAGKAYILSLVPLGIHTLRFERIDPQRRQIQTREKNRLISRWDHLISVREAPGGRTFYSDEIEIEAGPATWLVWLFAHWFYRHRQRRWKRIARRLAAQQR